MIGDDDELAWLSRAGQNLTNLEKRLAKSDNQEIDLNQIDPHNYTESLTALLAKARGPDYPLLLSQVDEELTNVLSKYLSSSFDFRKKIGAIFDDKTCLLSHLVGLPSQLSRRIQGPEDAKWFELGLVAALIENGRTDFRDLWVSLGELYEKAKMVGIEPLPHFREIGKLATGADGAFDRAYSGNNILSEFLSSEFRESLDR